MLAWNLWRQAKAYSTVPSKLLGVDDTLAAFYVDRSIFWFATFVEGEMDKAEGRIKNKKNPAPFIASARIRTFNKMMGIKNSTAGFRSVSKPGAPAENTDAKTKVFS